MARRRIAAGIGGLAVFGAGAVLLADFLQFGRTEPTLAAAPERADRGLVEKAARRLTLLREGRLLATYPVSLGFAPDGHKAREGDGRTPEGVYTIAFRNPCSVAHLSLKVSYPSPADEAAARTGGYSPGGDIMIHGLMNGFSWLGRLHRMRDWTQGCVGVTNAEMRAIYARVDIGTSIEIRP